eukprot:CAMPEP_0201726202 /NCGR_PEP_ID=MMETSP0593-20130828/9320_1 /ASSEMBLY_ACC=CAM_ASM_000672 /TAXON_ID=267983 /ORGANISM="Skeletonema japonicum, Strain CCMP2506" /LENGTH=299 /DNA_ID=CAMNT_0048217671 /DNA_START=85 /DNA_END=984 /DNA_ORIENTATION=+
MTRSSSTCIAAIAAAAAAASLHTCHAFVLPSSTFSSSSCVTQSPSFYAPSITVSTATSTSTTLFLSSTTPATTTSSNTLSLQLQKPLGLILEESDSTNPTNCGVIVTQVNEGGSAYASSSADKLTNAKITKVMETDVSSMSFDDVMDVIIGAPESLVVEFALAEGVTVEDSTAETEEATPTVEEYEIGTTVTITVEQPNNPNKPTIKLQAKVGDNLRKTLLANNDIELYRGLKKKLGNCGGGGQCGFCAVELEDDSESGMVWGERSEYEDGRIGKKVGTETQRLACMNNVLGPATVKTL